MTDGLTESQQRAAGFIRRNYFQLDLLPSRGSIILSEINTVKSLHTTRSRYLFRHNYKINNYNKLNSVRIWEHNFLNV